MQWTEQKVYKHIERYNGPEIVILIKDLLETLHEDELFKFGEGDDFPSIRIYNKYFSDEPDIIGIEFFKPFTSKPWLHCWVNFKHYENINNSVIIKIREFLGIYDDKKYPIVKADSPSELLDKIRSILKIIHDYFNTVS